MKQMIRIPFRKLLFVMTLMLGMIIAMSATSLAEGNVLSKGVTYNKGESFTIEESNQYVYLADEKAKSKISLPAGTYTIGEPDFDEDNKVWSVPISDEYDLTLGSGMGYTGDEIITGVECQNGTGDENDAFSFRLIGRNSSVDNTPVSYLAWDDTEKKLVESTCENYTFLKDAPKDAYDFIGKPGIESWFVVDEDYTGELIMQGDVHLILMDGVTVSPEDGVYSESGSVTIYAQSTGDNAGALTVKTDDNRAIYTVDADLTINGGKITAITDNKGAVAFEGAIYLWNTYTYGSNLTINAGEVTASCDSGSGIYAKGDVTINGGTVNATSTSNGYGIYGWDNVIVNDGVIAAKSENYSCIATNKDVEGGNVQIHGGRTTAECTRNGSGIETERVTIDGGSVTACGTGSEVNPGGIYIRGNYRSLDIGAGMTVMAGDNEDNAKDVTEGYKGQYAKKLIEDWVRISDAIYTVTFVDDKGNTLATKSVVKGDAAKAPQIPARAGHTSRWNKDFSNVTEDMTVTAVYEPIKVTSLRFRYIPKQLYEGSEDGIAVSISPTNALDKSVKYTSTDESVLTVNEKGRIKALKEGKATVKVETLDGSGLSVSRSIKVLHTHVWGEWEVTNPATTEADGEEARTCRGCGETETRAIPKLEHKHDLYLVKGTKATCTASGTKDYYECTGCEAIFEDGKGEKQTSFGDLDIPATGHNIGEPAKEGDETAATCSLPGGYNMYTRCKNCGAVLMVERYEIPIDPDAHVWDEGVVTKEATETETGIMTYTCKEDPSHTKTEVIPKLDPSGGDDVKPDPSPAPTATAAPVTTVTVNTKTVSAAVIQQAIQAAGGNVDTLVLGKSVKKIGKKAFAGTGIKTIVVESKKLKKKSVKGSLKGSSVTTVKVNVGKAKTNKKYVRKYKKIFTKKNAGKKVKVKTAKTR